MQFSMHFALLRNKGNALVGEHIRCKVSTWNTTPFRSSQFSENSAMRIKIWTKAELEAAEREKQRGKYEEERSVPSTRGKVYRIPIQSVDEQPMPKKPKLNKEEIKEASDRDRM